MINRCERRPLLADLLAAGLVVVALAVPARALAQQPVSNTYMGNLCVPASQNDIITSSGVAGPGGAEIICPIPKTTSGPNVSDDALQDVSLFTIENGNPVTCTLDVYNSSVSGDNSPNLEMQDTGESANGVLDFTSYYVGDTYDYWDAEWSSGWFYVEAECDLMPGQGVQSYTVQESGVVQPQTVIFPASTCFPDAANNTDDWQWDLTSLSSTSPGGFVQAVANNNSTDCGSFGCGLFVWDCPLLGAVSPGPNVTFAMTPTVNPQGTTQKDGCDGVWTTQWPAGGSWPSVTISFTATPGSSFQCTQSLPGDGDGQLLSYRTTP
jgi:hypothetical protein